MHDNMLVGNAARAVQVTGKAETAPQAARFARGTARREARLVGCLEGRLEQAHAVGRVVGVAARCGVGHVLGREQVQPPQLGRRAVGLVGGEIDQSL
jgi:hypothetical protein